ncbi:MAG: thiamine-phosphate kinase [Verrucomicrobiota bacterium]
MNEFELIAQLTRSLPATASVVTGPGDDCAVVDLGLPDAWLLLKTDAVVEGIHFTPATPARKVGYKALARCLSDVAAMGGVPKHAVITLALPTTYDSAYLGELYAGMSALAEKYQVAIVGGETTTNPERLLVSVALLGTVEKGGALLRSTAKPGDAIMVTGELGGSLAGKHLEFEPRLAEARWLKEHFSIHAMIDLSDGLAGDLRHILNGSQVGAELLAPAIPISRAAKLQTRQHPGAKTALSAALSDGEDFELLFTLPSKHAVPLCDAWKVAFPGLKLSCIGKITTGPGLKIRNHRGVMELQAHGYTHFA